MTNEELIQKQLDFYNNHDLQGFLSTYHEDIKIYNLDTHEVMVSGKSMLSKRYQERFEVLKVHAEVKNRMVLGDTVIDYENVTTIGDKNIVKAIAIYQIEDTLIKTVWFIYE